MADRQITEVLGRWAAGDPGAAEEALPFLYDELRGLARSLFRRERADHTLQPTAVVHEAFLRLQKLEGVSFRSRAQFLAFAAHVMRRVLVDHSRLKSAQRRGGEHRRVTWVDRHAAGLPTSLDVLDLDLAIEELARRDAQMAEVVVLRFYGGLSIEEAAQHLGVSQSTVSRSWRRAKAWLKTALSSETTAAESSELGARASETRQIQVDT